MRRTLLLIAAFFLGGVATAQQESPSGQAVDLESLPPEVRLGVRAEVVRRRWPVVKQVWIVRSSEHYLEALARWSLEGRFPVLIDDGSDQARERIGAFVRTFQPDEVLGRASVEADALIRPDGWIHRFASSTVPERVEEARLLAWGADKDTTLQERYDALDFVPPGVVVMSAEDESWTGGAALAIARGQPIIWTSALRGAKSGFVRDADLTSLLRDIDSGLGVLEYAWRDLGDDIDAITLCTNGPTKIRSQDQNALALTDRVGRFSDNRRYAWASVIQGNASESAYTAMCALFLQTRSVWLFDGYDGRGDFARYDVTTAGRALESAGITTLVDASDEGTLATWRSRTRRAVDAGLIHINSMGNSWFFQLRGRRAHSTGVPLLNRPAAVHFVHSFSAQAMGSADTIGATWIRRGAYAYVGSVHEPYLASFLTPTEFIARVNAPTAWAAAVRRPNNRVWKINVFGDALLTFGPPPPTAQPAEQRFGGGTLVEVMQRSIAEREFGKTAHYLVLLGQDADLIRIVDGIQGDADVSLTPEVARAALPAAVRLGRSDLVADLFESLPVELRSEPDYTDLLWLGLRPMLGTTSDARVVTLLRSTLTPRSAAEDVIEVAGAMRRIVGESAARELLQSALDQAERQQDKRRLERSVRDF